jgi:CRISPR-associated protein Cst2
MLFKVDVANPNAGWTEETVTPLKKIETPDNQRYPYISGQGLRRYLRDTLADIVEYDENGDPRYRFSPERPGVDPKSPILTEGRPDLYIDDDLFGFMRAVRGETRRRESPLRVSAGFGLFPYVGDRDLGTRSALRVTGNAEAGGAVFETEITNNVFRATWLLELDRVGRWKGYETTSNHDTIIRFRDATPGSLSQEEKDLQRELQKMLKAVGGDTAKLSMKKEQGGLEEKARKRWTDELFPLICRHQWTISDDDARSERVKALLTAIKYLSGGARQTRLLIELVPQFVIYARLRKKVPIFLNTLGLTLADGCYNLKTGPLTEVIKDYSTDIQCLILGVRDHFITMKREALLQMASAALGSSADAATAKVVTVGEAVDAMVRDIDLAEF